MKPARSPQFTGTFRRSKQSFWLVARTSASVDTVLTISTNFITGAGLKKCRPTTSPGLDVAAAHSTTGSDDVVVAKIATLLHTVSSVAKTDLLTSRSSATASTTRSTNAKSSSAAVGVTLASTAWRWASAIRPLLTARSRDFRTAATAARSEEH